MKNVTVGFFWCFFRNKNMRWITWMYILGLTDYVFLMFFTNKGFIKTYAHTCSSVATVCSFAINFHNVSFIWRQKYLFLTRFLFMVSCNVFSSSLSVFQVNPAFTGSLEGRWQGRAEFNQTEIIQTVLYNGNNLHFYTKH